MARVIRLTPLYRRRFEALGLRPRTPAAAAVGATIAALAEAATLPGLLDTRALIPPTSLAYVRRVGGRNLWLWFRVDNVSVWILTITAMPPSPLDE